MTVFSALVKKYSNKLINSAFNNHDNAGLRDCYGIMRLLGTGTSRNYNSSSSTEYNQLGSSSQSAANLKNFFLQFALRRKYLLFNVL